MGVLYCSYTLYTVILGAELVKTHEVNWYLFLVSGRRVREEGVNFSDDQGELVMVRVLA